ncbi:CPBP family intramembrane metalloprotease, partial [Clostridium perfringens]|nr:CPBP family intramembrane metalloprotease [Clostridium perfringens]
QIIGGICIVPLYIILSFSESLSSNLKILELFIALSSFVFISLLVFVRVKYIEKRSISTLGFSKDSWLKKYIKGFIIGLVMMAIVVLILYLLGCVSVEKNPRQPVGMSAIGGVMFILIGWIIQGGTEEIVTRGWLMNVLAARYNKA